MNIGVLIGRLNPPHLGHMRILDESLKTNDKTILFFGSANIKDEKNPYSLKKRKEFINIIYENNKKLFIEKLDDFKDDKTWILEIKKILKKYIKINDKIIFHGGDFKNDYAIKVIKKYKDLLGYKNISFKEIDRNKLNISSTKVREIIKKGDKQLLKKWVSDNLLDKLL